MLAGQYLIESAVSHRLLNTLKNLWERERVFNLKARHIASF